MSSISIFWSGAFIFSLPGIMSSYWKESLNVGNSQIGATMFFILSAVGIFMYIAGRMQITFGIKRILLLGILLNSFSLLILLKLTSIYLIYLWSFMVGLSCCFIYVPIMTTVQALFPFRKGLVSGIVNFVFGFSAAIMSPIFSFMLYSFNYTYTISALFLLSFATGVTAFIYFSEPNIQFSTSANKNVKHYLINHIIKSKNFWLIWLIWAFQGAAGISMVTLTVPYGIERGFTPLLAVGFLTAFNISNGLSRIISGSLSDMLSKKIIMSISFLFAGIGYILLNHYDNISAIYLFIILIGFSFGTLFTVSSPLIVECFGIEHFGIAIGAIFTSYGFLSGLIGPALTGYLLDNGRNWTLIFYYLSILSIISAILINFVKRENIDK